MTAASPPPREPADIGSLLALAEQSLRAGRFDEAAAACRQVLALGPDVAAAHNGLGIIAAQQNRPAEAIAHFEQALALRPDDADAHNNFGIVLRSQGRLAEAAAHYERAIALRGDYAEAHNNLGIVLVDQKQPERAVALFQRAIALHPGYAQAHNNLGAVFKDQKRLDEAAAHFRQAIALAPGNADAHNNLAGVLRQMRDLEAAETHARRALALAPRQFEAHNNLGNILAEQGRLDEAIASYRQSLTLLPTGVAALNNLASALRHQGRLDEALTHYREVLALQPGFVVAEVGLATCYLLQSDLARGWPAYEARLRMPGNVQQFNFPRWRGEPLDRRTLLLLAEQGFGDTIQFVRYAGLFRERGARVVLAAQAELCPLLASYRHIDELVPLGPDQQVPTADYYLPLLSAPEALGTTLTTIPAGPAYLSAEPARRQAWRSRLAAIGGFQIGIAWQGSRTYLSDRLRSVPLREFAPLAALPGVKLVSLQKGFGSEQVATAGFPLVDFTAELDATGGAFLDTAAVISQLDLVVTSDTAIAHLAGALGASVWVALPVAPDWRWLLDRDDSPWYPTMRLFRQLSLGDWPSVFRCIAAAATAHRAPPSLG